MTDLKPEVSANQETGDEGFAGEQQPLETSPPSGRNQEAVEGGKPAKKAAVARKLSEEALRVGKHIGLYLVVLALVLLYVVYALWPRTAESQPPVETLIAQTSSDDLPAGQGSGAPPPTAAENAGNSETDQPPPNSEPSAIEESEAPTAAEIPTNSSREWGDTSRLAWASFDISPQVRILLLVILIGALGSVIGGASSFATYMGNKTFEPSWSWWYYLRPVVGAVLALVFYVVIRAGFSQAFSFENLDQHLFRATAIAALTGMFSKLTADKLEDIFSTILQSRKDEHRKDKPKPELRNDAAGADDAAGAGAQK